jgi:hypothetical protein
MLEPLKLVAFGAGQNATSGYCRPVERAEELELRCEESWKQFESVKK